MNTYKNKLSTLHTSLLLCPTSAYTCTQHFSPFLSPTIFHRVSIPVFHHVGSISRVPDQNGVFSSMIYSRDTPFWSGTLDMDFKFDRFVLHSLTLIYAKVHSDKNTKVYTLQETPVKHRLTHPKDVITTVVGTQSLGKVDQKMGHLQTHTKCQ